MHLYLVKDKIQGKCDSCPFNGDVDNKHKIVTYMLKKPPAANPQAPKKTKEIQKIKGNAAEEKGAMKSKVLDEKKTE